MKNHKYITNMSGSVAVMHVYEDIGYGGVNGYYFAVELRYLIEEKNFKEIQVRINSVGGSVFEGFSIFSAILNAINEGHNVNTYCDGVAASMAGVILLAGKKIFMKDYSRAMIHGVSLSTEDGEPVSESSFSESDADMIDSTENMILTAIHGRTGVDKAYLKGLMTNGKDNWFTPSELIEIGFPIEIQETGHKIDAPNDALVLSNMAKKIINNNSSKKLNMKKVTALLGINENANEDSIAKEVNNKLTLVNSLTSKIKELENSLKEKEEENQKMKDLKDEADKVAATSIVDVAINKGQLSPKTEKEKSTLINQATANPEAFQSMINMIPVKAARITNSMNIGREDKKDIAALVNGKSMRQLERENPSLLNDLKASNPANYAELFNAEYGTQKTAADFS